jgi:hypothetical protein
VITKVTVRTTLLQQQQQQVQQVQQQHQQQQLPASLWRDPRKAPLWRLRHQVLNLRTCFTATKVQLLTQRQAQQRRSFPSALPATRQARQQSL